MNSGVDSGPGGAQCQSAVADTSSDTAAFALAAAALEDLVRLFRMVAGMVVLWESSPNRFRFGGIRLQQNQCTLLVQYQ